MASEEAMKLYNEVLERGCCNRCVLRYLGQPRSLLTFEDPDICLVNFGYMSPLEEILETSRKRQKRSPCPVCLGLLDDGLIEDMINSKVLAKVGDYAHDNMANTIAFPACITLRDHSMKLHLKSMFPESFNAEQALLVKQAWQDTILPKLSRTLNRTQETTSLLKVQFRVSYILEEDEMQVARGILGRKGGSKHSVRRVLESITDEKFKGVIKVPPNLPLYEVTLAEVKCWSESIFLSGVYHKFSRTLPQGAMEKGDTVVRHSVETIIQNAVKSALGFRDFDMVSFHASSYDDPHVRVLGSGRSFRLQIENPRFSSVSHEQCRQIELFVRRSREIQVHNLRETDRKEANSIGEREKLSPKSFKILCAISQCKNVDFCINAVNMFRNLTINQLTPLKLLHRRAWSNKEKKIFHIKATKVKNNLVELDLCVSAGFYVSEFVSGDFGRTRPSLGEIMRAKVHLLAIDVIEFGATLPCALEEEDVVI